MFHVGLLQLAIPYQNSGLSNEKKCCNVCNKYKGNSRVKLVIFSCLDNYTHVRHEGLRKHPKPFNHDSDYLR